MLTIFLPAPSLLRCSPPPYASNLEGQKSNTTTKCPKPRVYHPKQKRKKNKQKHNSGVHYLLANCS